MAVYRDIDSDVRINGNLTLPSGSLTMSGVNIINALAQKVETTTAVNAGDGLTGGGALTTDRTLAVSFGTTAATVARGDHAHAFGELTSRPTTLTGYGITDASAVGHTHTFASLTAKPTKLAGYGITDASPSTHKHDADYLKLSGGNLTGGLMAMADDVAIGADTGALRLGFLKKSGAAPVMGIAAGTSFKIMQSSATNLTENIATQVLDELLHVSSSYFSYNYETVYHSGNFTPADKADLSALTTHTNNATLHKDWGDWATNGGPDLTVNSKRALVHVNASNKLMMNYANDFAGGVEIAGTLTNGGYEVYHAGNLSMSDFVSASSAATVVSNFTVKGRIWAGDSSAAGSLVVKDAANQNAIHLGGTSALSNVKAHIASNGSAKFNGAVQVANLIMDSSVMVPNLNAEFIGGTKETAFVRTDSVRDMQGYGVHAGLEVVQKSPTPDMTVQVRPGIAYTDSGRRFEWTANAVVPVPQASANYDRIDIVFIYGKADGANEGSLGLLKGLADRVTPLPPTDLLPAGAIVLAELYVRANIGTITDGTSGSYDAVDNSMKGMKSVRLAEGLSFTVKEAAYIGGDIHEKGAKLESKYAQLATDNLFRGDIKIRNSGGTSLVVQSDNGHSSDSYPATLYLKEDDHFEHGLKVEYLGDSNMGVISTMQSGNKSDRITISRATGQVTLKEKAVVEGHFEAQKNATTVTIPAGTRSVTWTHGYGTTAYAVNLTTNSFERHIRWTSKTANSVVVELDDPSGQETLVDCILIGY